MKRILSLAAALALFAFLIPLTLSTVLAWQSPTIAAVCPQAQDENQVGVTDFNWYVSLHGTESNYNMEWSTNGTDWAGPIDWSDQNDALAGGGWGGPLVTTSLADNGGDHLWVRWGPEPITTGPVFNDCKGETQSEAPSTAPSTAPSEAPVVTPTPVITPTPEVTPAPTPARLAAATPPPTATEPPSGNSPPPIVLIGFALLGILFLMHQWLPRRQ
jgi:hypothetical protein